MPVEGVTLEDCAAIAHRVGKRVGDELEIPVYFYEAAALTPERRNLAAIREGEYERLAEKLADPRWKPDCGPARFNPRTGATVIGAREFLIAYNVTLNTRDKAAATDIAFELRETGRVARDKTASPYYSRGEVLFYREGHFPCGNCGFVGKTFEETRAALPQRSPLRASRAGRRRIADFRTSVGQKVRRAGKFPCCKAIGWYVDQYRRAQISINLTNYRVTPPHLVLEEARRLAAERGLVVTGSEVVGMIPYRAMLEAGKYYLDRQGGSCGVPAADLLEAAVFSMGLGDVQPFDPREESDRTADAKERFSGGLQRGGFCRRGLARHARPRRRLDRRAGRLARRGAGLDGRQHHPPQDQRAPRSSSSLRPSPKRPRPIKDKLLAAVDEDTEAFNAYLEALRLPADTPEQKQLRDREDAGGPDGRGQRPLSDGRAEFRGHAGRPRNGAARPGRLADRRGGGLRDGLCRRAGRNLERAHQSPPNHRPPLRRRKTRALRQLLEDARKLLDQTAEAVDRKLAERIGR